MAPGSDPCPRGFRMQKLRITKYSKTPDVTEVPRDSCLIKACPWLHWLLADGGFGHLRNLEFQWAKHQDRHKPFRAVGVSWANVAGEANSPLIKADPKCNTRPGERFHMAGFVEIPAAAVVLHRRVRPSNFCFSFNGLNPDSI